MTIKHGIRPNGGYKFRDSDGAVHEGESWAHLVRVVAKYRALRKIPAGDPQKEITEAVCMAEPTVCHKGPGELGDGDRDAFHLRIIAWLTDQMKLNRSHRLKFVDGVVAGERAEICRKCHFQRSFAKGCQSCGNATVSLQAQAMAGHVDVGPDLMGCSLLSEDTKVSVHLDQVRLNNPNLPKHCWRKK